MSQNAFILRQCLFYRLWHSTEVVVVIPQSGQYTS